MDQLEVIFNKKKHTNMKGIQYLYIFKDYPLHEL